MELFRTGSLVRVAGTGGRSGDTGIQILGVWETGCTGAVMGNLVWYDKWYRWGHRHSGECERGSTLGNIGRLVGCWLLNVPATCECISGTDLHRQLYVLPH